jgi:SAM-dependent methyltransferase
MLTCGRHPWPIVGGIPRFVPEEAYAASFGFQWTRFSRLQLDTGDQRESEETFTRKTGLTPGDVAGATVLDVGCGMGRFSDVVARWGGRVVGIDLSGAVVAASRNLETRKDAAILQSDVFNLPFRDSAFDLIFSLGVLHHTPDTREAFLRLPRLVRPGGTVAIWVYSKHLRRHQFGSEVLRLATRRMSPERLLPLVERWVPRVHAFRQSLPSSSLRRLVNWLVPVSTHADAEWRVLDTFDWYSPWFQWKHSFPEVEDWFREAGMAEIESLSIPVAVRGRRPR